MAQTKKTEETKTIKTPKAKAVKTVEATVEQEVAIEVAAEEKEEFIEAEEQAPVAETESQEAAVETVEQTGEDNNNEASLEKTQSLVEEFSNPEQKVEEIINNNPDNTAEALKAELDRVEAIEAKVKKEVENTEKKISKPQKKASISFGNFWNGVSDGWNN